MLAVPMSAWGRGGSSLPEPLPDAVSDVKAAKGLLACLDEAQRLWQKGTLQMAAGTAAAARCAWMCRSCCCDCCRRMLMVATKRFDSSIDSNLIQFHGLHISRSLRRYIPLMRFQSHATCWQEHHPSIAVHIHGNRHSKVKLCTWFDMNMTLTGQPEQEHP